MPQTVLKLPKQLLDRIDKLARDQNLSRGEIMRQLLTEALAARKGSPKSELRTKPTEPPLAWDDHVQGICSGIGKIPGASDFYTITPHVESGVSSEDFFGYAVYRVDNADNPEREQLGTGLKTYQEAKAFAEADHRRRQS
jgi:hypothetical protein